MIRKVTPQEAAAAIGAGDAILLDVREPAEFAAGHIAEAMSVPLSQLPRVLARLPAAKGIIFQCERGARGESACAVAAASGRTDVANLAGGLAAWRQAGLPVIGAASAGVSIFRQVQMIVGAAVALLVALGFAGWTPGFAIAGLMGAMLAVAGVTGWCGLAMLLARMPWNRPAAAS